LSSEFWIHALGIEQSARPGGPNMMGDPCTFKTNFQNSLDNFEARFVGNGKTKVLFCAAQTAPKNRLPFIASTPMSKQFDFPKCRFFYIYYYVTPACP
jgi:hypothetical protein